MNLPPGWRLFSDLSKQEAEEILTDYVTALPGRADELTAYVRERGGPADALDYGRDSLVPLWTWFLGAHQLPEPPATEEELRASDPSWWFDFHPPLGMRLGPDLAPVATILSAYFIGCLLRARPASRWVVGAERRGADFRMPLLYVDRGGAWGCDSAMVGVVLNGLGSRDSRDEPTHLRDLYDLKLGMRKSASAASEGVGAFEVARRDAAGFSHQVAFDETVAHEEQERVTAFVSGLRLVGGIGKVHQEDREVVLVDAREVEQRDLENIVRQVWADTRAKIS